VEVGVIEEEEEVGGIEVGGIEVGGIEVGGIEVGGIEVGGIEVGGIEVDIVHNKERRVRVWVRVKKK
jgi:hypothetical protein